MCASKANKTEPLAPSLPTIKRLYAVSGNVCAFPSCPNPLVDEASGTVTSEVCHIKGHNPGTGNRRGSARYDSNQTPTERHGFQNLILMCSNHHNVIDSDETTGPADRLQKLKAKHEKMHKGGHEPSNDIARQFQLTITNGSFIYAPNQQGGQIAHSITSVTNNVSGFDKMFQSRDDLRGLRDTARAMGVLANVGDPYWTRTVSTDGRLSLTPNSPDAHKFRPLKVSIETQALVPGSKTLLERLEHVAETQEDATISGAELVGLKTFLGDTLIEDLQDLLQHLTVVITAAPLGPIINCALRVQDVGGELKSLNIDLYAMSGSRLRFTNRQDDQAHAIISIDFHWTSSVDSGDDDAIDVTGGEIAIQSRTVPKRTMRHLLEFYTFVRALSEPRTIELYEPTTSHVHFMGYGATIDAVSPDQEAFIDAMQTVQNAFPMKDFPMLASLKRREVEKLFEIAKIVRTGQATVSLAKLSAPMDAGTITNLLKYAGEDGAIGLDENGVKHNLHLKQGQTTHTLFGVPIALGPSIVDLPPMKMTRRSQKLRNDVARLSADGRIDINLVPVSRDNKRILYRYTDYEKPA